MAKDCKQPLRNGLKRALNGCAGRLFGAATHHSHKNTDNKSYRKVMNRNWSKQNPNPTFKTKMGNKQELKLDKNNKTCGQPSGQLLSKR